MVTTTKNAVKECIPLAVACLLLIRHPRSIFASCRVPSHASVKEMSEGDVQGSNVRFQEAMLVPQCIGVVNRNLCGRPRVLHIRRSSASSMTAQSLLHMVIATKKTVWIE